MRMRFGLMLSSVSAFAAASAVTKWLLTHYDGWCRIGVAVSDNAWTFSEHVVASMIYDSPCGMSASRFALSQQLVKFPNLLLIQPFSKCCFIGFDPRLSALPANFVASCPTTQTRQQRATLCDMRSLKRLRFLFRACSIRSKFKLAAFCGWPTGWNEESWSNLYIVCHWKQ